MTQINELPHNVELEQQILGALLTNNETYHKISGLLKTEHFHDPVHQEIWKNIAGRIEREHTASPVTLRVDFETHEGLKELGGVNYLVKLAGSSISGFAIVDYCRELAAIWQRRTLIQSLRGCLGSVEGGGDTEAAKCELEGVLAGLPDASGKENSVSMLRAVTEAVGDMNRSYAGEDVSLMTGIRSLDDKTGGLWPADLIILAGRPSMGKTAVAVEIARCVAVGGKPVVVVSLEMTEKSIAQRLISQGSSVPYSDARKGNMTEKEFRRVIESAKVVGDLPISLIPPHVREVASIYSAIKKEKARLGGLGLVVIDYLQLIRARGNGRTEQMTEVSIQLKHMAKMLDVPVVALSQLSRQVEQRDNKRPVLSDLRESGQIEQDADAVIFCYRDYYYLSREKPPEKADARADYESALAASKNQMELIIAKQRMGAIGTARVGCAIATNKFWDLDEQKDIEF